MKKLAWLLSVLLSWSFLSPPARSQNLFAGLFRAASDAHAAWITSNWGSGPESFLSQWAEFERNGLRMVDFETYTEGAVRVYAGIFRAGNDGHAAWITSNWSDGPDSFTKKWEEFEKGGLRMIDFETWTEGRARVYAGLFRAGNDGHAAWITSNWSDGPDSFTKKWEEWNQAGLRMIDLETWEEG
ncbi:MAG: hypothetical protein HY717_21255, partial [Planctomycetes bacterium]|nr:hypothetical protein [Planctomycetota bacterium]